MLRVKKHLICHILSYLILDKVDTKCTTFRKVDKLPQQSHRVESNSFITNIRLGLGTGFQTKVPQKSKINVGGQLYLLEGSFQKF